MDPTRILLQRGGQADPSTGEVVRDGRVVCQLTSGEVDLLRFFSARPGVDVSRETLAVEVLGQAPGLLSRAVDSAVYRLRTKIEVDPAQPSQLIKVQGTGYRWIAAVPTAGPTNLPPAREETLGRAEALASIAPVLERSGAVTITGAPGIGKTTLALTYARSQTFSGGVLLVDLSDSRSAGALVTRVAQVLEVSAEEPGTEAAIGWAVANRGDVLLVLDDADAVTEALAPRLAAWRKVAPRSRWVITSRSPLGGAGEEVLALEPLDPDVGQELFVARARAVRSGWTPTAAEQVDVALLVAALDGIPLAIELAASRIGAMSPAGLLERLSERLRLLRRPGRDRQATLRAAIEASWDLLSPEERSVFAQLSVFVGPFDRATVRRVVLPDHGDTDPWLDRLVARSLVARADAGRFRLLASLWAYATERLAQPEEVWRRHADHFTRDATRITALLLGPRGAEIISRLSDEAPEVRAVVDRFVDTDPERTALAVLVCRPGMVRTPLDEQVDSAALALPPRLAGAPLPLRCALQRVAAYTLRRFGRYDEARSAYEAACTLAVETGDPREIARSKVDRCSLAIVAGQLPEALRWGEDAEEAARTLGDDLLLGLVLQDLGVAYRQAGRLADARRSYDGALAVASLLDAAVLRAMVTGNRAVVDAAQGHTHAAREGFEDAIRMHTALGNLRSAGVARANLAQLCDDCGDLEAAEAHLLEALQVMRKTGSRRFEGVLHSNLGSLHARTGRLALAARELDQALAIARELRQPRDEAVAQGEIGLLAWIEEDPAAAAVSLRSAVALGAGLRDEAFHRAFLGGVLAVLGAPEADAEIDRAEQMGREVGDPSVAQAVASMRTLAAVVRGAPVPEEVPSAGGGGFVRFAAQQLARAIARR